MYNILQFIKNKLLGKHLEFRIRLFNILVSFGVLISLISAVTSFFLGDDPVEYGIYLLFCLLSVALLIYSTKTGKYQRCYTITIILVFMVGFPIFFFTGGMYYGALTYFFIFAVLFTIFMLEGRRAIFMSALELILYIAISFYARYYMPIRPEYQTADSIFFESVFGFSVVSAALGVCLYLHFRLYNEQQRKLNEQNEILANVSRAKTEFFANASHEMRTPLTVISVNVQTVTDILDELSLRDGETKGLLQSAQSEIMRLARMVGGMLTLASMSEMVDKQEIDLTSLLQNGAEMLRLNLYRRGNALETSIEKELCVFGNADLLVQVLINLLQNAGAHTENGTVTVHAAKGGKTVNVTVQDTGTGITLSFCRMYLIGA